MDPAARFRRAVAVRRGRAAGVQAKETTMGVGKNGQPRQLAWVFDLNRCIGCQTCSVACKVLWTQGAGTDHMWWCTVNTQPGRGTPRDYEQMGGGYDANGTLAVGRLPTAEEVG